MKLTTLDDEVDRLRQWLHRIEEACAKKDASPTEKAVRDAAISALRGKEAPDFRTGI